MKTKNYATIWHQPTDMPSLGTVEQIEEVLTSRRIPYETGVSNLNNHVKFSVPKSNVKEAVKFIKLKYGRNV